MTKDQFTKKPTRKFFRHNFSGCIFPLRMLTGLTGNRPQSASAFSFLRLRSYYESTQTLKRTFNVFRNVYHQEF